MCLCIFIMKTAEPPFAIIRSIEIIVWWKIEKWDRKREKGLSRSLWKHCVNNIKHILMLQLNKLIRIMCMQQRANERTSFLYLYSVFHAICILTGFEWILYDMKQQSVIFAVSNSNLENVINQKHKTQNTER